MFENCNRKESERGFLHMLLLPSLHEATSEFNEVQARQRREGAIFSQLQDQDVNNVPPSKQTEQPLREHNRFYSFVFWNHNNNVLDQMWASLVYFSSKGLKTSFISANAYYWQNKNTKR